jgi:large subunit ribosomal protein L2
VGQSVVSGNNVAPELGNAMPIGQMPLGSIIHNLELYPGRGGVIVRSAGASAQLLAKEERYAAIKLPSGEMRRILLGCVATIGTVSNLDHGSKVWVRQVVNVG